MKKRLLAILVLLVLAVFALTSCNLFFTPEKPTYKVTFDVDGGSAVESQVITHKETVTKPDAPTKEGHTFDGWYADEKCTTAWDFEKNPITSQTTIYAKWNLNSHTVSFVGAETDGQTVDWGKAPTQPADPTKVGHTFGGWFADEGFQTAFDFTKPIKGDTTVYAKWNINSYTVSFDAEGVASQTVQFGSLATKPTDPTKTGYTFRGWLLGGAAFDFATPITESISLSANWEINKHTITYTDGVDGETVFEDKVFKDVPYGSATPTIAEPTRQGYQFNGWDIDVADTVSGDVTYTATWVLVHEHSYTVKNTSAKYLKTEATCTEPAVYYYSCSQCIAKGSETFQHGAPLGHDMGAWTETKAPTCTETGSEKRDCSRCDHSETRVVDAKGHSYSSVVTAPTCTADGYTTHTCGDCGHSYTDTPVGKLGHNMGAWTQTKAPTCTDKGTEKRSCTRCSHFETRDVEALKHSFTTYVYNNDATCTEDGTETAKCDRCDETDTRTKSGTAGHKYGQLKAGTDATCTSTGTISHYQCSGCNKYFNENKEPVDSITIPKNSQHTSTEFVYVNNNDGTHSKTHKCCGAVVETTDCSDVTTDNDHNCDICGQENASEHTDGNDNDHLCDNGCGQVADNGCHGGTATCVAKAVCEECGQEYGDIDLANHIWEEGKLLCTRDCGYEKVEVWKLVTDVSKLKNNAQIIIVSREALDGYYYALGNTQNSNNRTGVVIDINNITTENNGVQIITLKEGTVNGTFAFYVEGDSSGYLYAAGSDKNYLRTGELNDNASWSIQIDGTGIATIKAKGNNTRNWLRFNPNSGNTNRLFSCYGSGQKDVSIYMLTEEVKLHEHTVVVDNAVTPGCESTGLTEGSHCKTCGEVLVAQEEIPANGHSKSPVKTDAKAPDCETTGTKAYWQCSECEGYFSDEACTKEIENLAAWLQTEGENGGLVAATGHTEVIDQAVAATCTSKGLTEGKHCDVCKKVLVEQEETSVLPHVDTNPKDNICDVCGNTVCVHEGGTANCKQGAICTKCGNEYGSTDPQNHVNTTEHQQVNATCTAVGYKAGVQCDDCKAWISGHEEIEAIAHKNKVHHAKVDATCMATGTIEYWSCPDCNKNFSDEACTTEVTDLTIAIDSTNHVNTTDHEQTNATCTEVGYTVGTYCEDCNTWVSGHEEIKALGHKDEDGNYACDNGCGKYIVVTNVTIADYADANGWANGTYYGTIIVDSNITVTALKSGDNGKYYTSGKNWRIYQSNNGTFTISSEGKTITSVTITYTPSNNGYVVHGENKVESGKEYTVNGTSITFSVKTTTSGKTNGQARITAIEVSYVVDEMPTNTVTINYVDEKGNKIGESKTIEVATGSNFDFNDNITSIDNYTFQKWLNFEDEEIDGSIKINSDITVTAVYNHNHSFTNYESDGNATCTEDGTKTATCDIDGCNVTDTVDDIDSKLGHEDENKDHACDNGCNVYQGEHKDTNADHVCDYGCTAAIGNHADSAEDTDHICDYGCGATLEDCVDNDKDHACDNGCDKTFGEHVDAGKDHVCDYGCAESIGTCEDKDFDHDCDYGCDATFGIHADGDDNNHLCDYGCGQMADDGCHDVETDDNHNCDECGEPCGEHSYTNEIVDAKYLKSAANCTSAAVYYKSCNCGEYEEDVNNTFTYGGVNAENHTSEETSYINKDGDTHTKIHVCCNAVIETVAHTFSEWTPAENKQHTHSCVCGKTETAACSDAEDDKDHNCDNCGQAIGEHSYTDKKDETHHWKECNCGDVQNKETHTFANWTQGENDTHTGTCSCGETKTENCSGGTATCQTAATCTKCGEQYGDVDPNGHYDGDDENNNCDGCGASLCETHTEDEGTITTQPGCETTGTRTYKCTACGVITRTETVAKTGHKDENKDHACDNGCSVYQGEHKDTNADHVCDYGCNVAIGNCEDANKDHKCDYGCGKDFGTHADSADDDDHVCDYGCGATLEDCVDNDKDHACDNGCDKTFGEHVDAGKDHVCDYGCAESIGTCEDKDFDHDCDYGCDATFGIHADGDDNNHLCDYGCGQMADDGCHDVETDDNHNCDECGEPCGEHSYTNEIVDAKYLKSAANCTSAAVYYKSCNCGAFVADENANTFESGEALGHSENAEGDKAATCQTQAYCSRCESTYGSTDANNHVKDPETDTIVYNYTSNGDKTHKVTYACCDATYAESASCVAADNSHNCKDCGQKISECSDVANDGDHNCDVCGEDDVTEHTDGDDNNHLCDNGCGQVADDGCHDAENDGDHNCDECDAENVTTCSDAENDGDHNCDECDAENVTNCSGGTATCITKAFCEECGEEYGEVDLTKHNFVGDDVICSDCRKYEKVESWQLVTDVSKLEDGVQIIIVSSEALEGYYYALSNTQNSNNRNGVVIDINNITTENNGVQIITLEEGITDGTFAFYVVGTKTGYLYATGGSNYLRTQDDVDANASWAITISNGIATIKSQTSGSRNLLRFNPNTGKTNRLFSCYESGQKDVSIYMLTVEVKEHEHTATHVPEVAAGCESAGTKEYWNCSVCGKHFSDEDCTVEIEDLAAWKAEGGEGYLSAKGHNYGTLIAEDPASCTENGTEAHYECSVCENLFQLVGEEYVEVSEEDLVINAGHNYGTLIEEDPESCTENGTEAHYKCSGCEKLFQLVGEEYVEVSEEDLVINAGHIDVDPENNICDRCSESLCTHETCTTESVYVGIDEEGKHYHKIVYSCGITKIESELCTDNPVDGYVDHKCDVCGKIEISEHTGGQATCQEKATCTLCNQQYGELNSNNHPNANITYVNNNDGTHKVVCSCSIVIETSKNHTYEDGYCVCGAKEPVEKTVTINISDYASTNSWVNGVYYGTLVMDDNITVTALASGNNGKYYTSGTNWRMYQSDGGYITITASEGIIISSVKITYSSSSGGVLVYNSTKYSSNTTIDIGKQTAKISVGNTDTATNGQARITAIEVVYEVSGGTEECTHPNATSSGDEATCTEDGELTYECPDCKATWTENPEATGHNYVNGTCSNCGASESTQPKVVLEITKDDFNNTSYAANNNTKTENGYSYTSNQVMKQSVMQWQKNTGYITIESNVFVKLEIKVTAGTFTVTVGGKTVTGTTTNGVTTYDLTGLTGQVKISVGSATGQVEYLKFYK